MKPVGMFGPALSACPESSPPSLRIVLLGAAATLTLAACGAGAPQAATEPHVIFPVQITSASFPASQRLAQQTTLSIAVRNIGAATIPVIAVTITNPSYGTSVQAFATYLDTPGLANHSRPVWIVNRPPGSCGPGCLQGRPGGAVTAYANTWALGTLAPGRTATFEWRLTAVRSGTYKLRYRVAAGLGGNAKAVLADGSEPVGTFTVTIHSGPPRVYINNSGQVATAP